VLTMASDLNRKNLKKVVAKLEPFMERQKVAFWGASKIFDALVRFGGLKTDSLICVVDEYLWKILPEAHGIAVEHPDVLKEKNPDVVIVLACSSANEIARKIRRLGIRNVVIFSQLLSSVKV